MANDAAANIAAPLQAVKWSSATINTAGGMEAGLIVVIAIIILRLEFQRRASTSQGTNVGSLRPVELTKSCKRILCQCAPEALGLLTCLAVASALLARGDVQQVAEEQTEAWLQIKREWPLLTCGDTLLSIQAMLRFVVLLSVVLHGDGEGPEPMGEETAALHAGGCLARSMCFLMSPVYWLDGPLGGNMPAVCDVVSFGLALALGRKIFRKNLFVAVFTSVCIFWLSCRHNLNLSENESIADKLFMVAYFFECFAALTHLARTLLADAPFCCASVLRNSLMAIQAPIGAYYFVYAFTCDGLSATNGTPCEVLQLTHLVAGGAYLCSAGILLADASLGSDPSFEAHASGLRVQSLTTSEIIH